MGRKSTVVLGIDPAKRTGFALMRGKRLLLSGSFSMPTKKKDEQRPGWRFREFRASMFVELSRCCNVAYPDVIAIEWANNMRSGVAMAMHGWVRYELLAWADSHGVAVTTVNPTDVKVHATGDGNATKTDMMKAAAEKFRIEFGDNDEADAVWIADYARKNL